MAPTWVITSMTALAQHVLLYGAVRQTNSIDDCIIHTDCRQSI